MLIRVLCLVAVVGLFTLPSADAGGRTAMDTVRLFQDTGFPIFDVVALDEESDPAHLLGRPGQYVERVTWHDLRLAERKGGSIERFANVADLRARVTYAQNFANDPILGGYMWANERDLLVLYLSFELTPVEADDYRWYFFEG